MLRVSLLGEQHVSSGAGTADRENSSRLIALLAFLILHAGAPQPRQHLAGVFWPDSTEPQARTNLRRELHHLRALLGGDSSLVVEPTSLMWRDTDTCRVDLRTFLQEQDRARECEAAADADGMLTHAESAVAAYHGDFLPGSYDDWVLDARDRLRRRCVELCDLVVAGRRARGDLGRALGFARERVRLEPCEELGYRQLMGLQSEAGDRAGALGTFHRCAATLERELGVRPSADTTRLLDELLRSDRGHSAAQPSAARSGKAGTTLVGRKGETRRVVECWNEVAAGRPGLLVVSGEAGVGKTRVVAELARYARSTGATVATTRCFGTTGQPALAPVGEWLRHPEFRRGIDGLERVWRAEVERLLPADSAPAGAAGARPVPRSSTTSLAMVDAWKRHRFFEGLARTVLAAEAPTLLVLDDLQWCDEETTAWLSFLLRFAAGTPLLVAATARSADAADNHEVGQLLRTARSADLLTEITLHPMTPDEVGELAATLSSTALGPADATSLFEATGGLPIYVVEALRRASVASRPGATAYPPDLTTVLHHRFEEVSPHARQTAQLAAAVGRDFSLDLLCEASDLDIDSVVRSVDELWRHRILREEGSGYDFSHDLVRDTVYASVSPPRRWLLHRRLAQSLELLNADRSDDVAAQLAEQYERGGRPDRALRFHRRAAEVAAEVFAHAASVRSFERALDLIRALPPGRARDEQELDVLMAMSPPANALYGYASRQLQEATDRSAYLAERLGRRRDLMAALVGKFAVHIVQGHIPESHAVAKRSLELLESNPELAGQAHLAFAGSSAILGRLEQANRHFHISREQSLGSPSQMIGTLPDVHGMAWHSHVHWLLGDAERAAASGQAAVDKARERDHPFSLAVALAYFTTTQQLLADTAAAEASATELVELCERFEFAFYHEWGMVVAGWAKGGQAGTDQINQGLQVLRATGSHLRMPYWLTLLADVLVRDGRAEFARPVLDAALADSMQRDERWWLPEVLRRQAQFLSDAAAVEVLRRGVQVAAEQGSVVLAARCEQDLAARAAGAADSVRVGGGVLSLPD